MVISVGATSRWPDWILTWNLSDSWNEASSNTINLRSNLSIPFSFSRIISYVLYNILNAQPILAF